jgi:hypothetical protein
MLEDQPVSPVSSDCGTHLANCGIGKITILEGGRGSGKIFGSGRVNFFVKILQICENL